MFQLTHKKEPARTTKTVLKLKAAPRFSTQSQTFTQAQALLRVLEWNWFLSSGLEDCEPLVEPEDFGRGGVGVGAEPEYDLELRIGGNVSARDGAFKLVDGPNSALVRWSKEKASLKGCITHELRCHELRCHELGRHELRCHKLRCHSCNDVRPWSEDFAAGGYGVTKPQAVVHRYTPETNLHRAIKV